MKCIWTIYFNKCILMHLVLNEIWKNNIFKIHTVWTFPKCNRKIPERGKIDTPYTQIHDHSLSCLNYEQLQNKYEKV